MANYKYCPDCKVEHDEFGRTREENEKRERQLQEDPAFEAREQLKQVKLALERDPENDPSLSLAYINNAVANPTMTVKSLQLTYTKAATMALKVRNAVTGQPEDFLPGDAIAAIVRTAIDGVCSSPDIDSPDMRERVLTLFTSALDEAIKVHRERRPEILEAAKEQRQMLSALVQSLEVMVSVAEKRAKDRKTNPLPIEAAALPVKRESESAEEAAARVHAEQAILLQLTKANSGKVH